MQEKNISVSWAARMLRYMQHSSLRHMAVTCVHERMWTTLLTRQLDEIQQLEPRAAWISRLRTRVRHSLFQVQCISYEDTS